MRTRTLILVALLLLTAAAVAGVAQPQLARSGDAPTTRTITVNGAGSVSTVPDRASFGFSVDTRGKTAAAALASNADAARAVVAALKSAGVTDANIQTTQVSLNPQTGKDGTSIVGFAASSSVSVDVPIAQAGRIVDTAVGAGATGVSGPSLVRSDQAGLYQAALKAALSDAATKAQTIAAAAGLQLGAVQTVVEGSSSPPIAFDKTSAGMGAVPIEPGSQQIQASVTVTYAVT